MKNATRLGILSLVSGVFFSGCAHAHFALPMTAGQMTEYSRGAALGAYLRQPEASAEVCDQEAAIPHIRVVDEEARRAVDRGFRKGRISPPVWNLCMESLLHDAAPPLSQALMDEVTQDALDTLHEKGLESDTAQQARLDSIWQLFSERDLKDSPSPAVLKKLVSGIKTDVAKHRLGPIGFRHAQDLLAILELEQGRWQGSAVNVALLDDLMAQNDERTLRLFMRRLPDATLRTLAERDIVELHIKASPFAEVRGAASHVESAMMKGGANPVSLSQHPLLHGRLDAAKVPVRQVVVEQEVSQQKARLISYRVDGSTTATVLPSIPLRGTLEVDLKGLSKPITVCSSGKDLDVSPCLVPSDLGLGSPYGTLTSSGVLHFTDMMDESSAVKLARSGQNLLLPILVAGAPVATLEWPVSFKTPDDLVFAGSRAGASGPPLDVRVDVTTPARLLYQVSSPGLLQPYSAVVERSAVEDFHIVSQGAEGYTGARGSDGMAGANGFDGASASCPSSSGTSGGNGGDGGAGGDGSPGGAGGDGGPITVTLTGDPAAKAEVHPLLYQTILSEGGSGGSGGSGGTGGAGGHGGQGGSGDLCWTTDENGNPTASTTLSGGANGMDGRPGPDGSGGPSGASGRSGQVRFIGI